MGRFEDAVKARRDRSGAQRATAERHSGLGEALTAAANGVVTAEALAAFKAAVALDAEHVKARFFLGLAAEQDGPRERGYRDLARAARRTRRRMRRGRNSSAPS